MPNITESRKQLEHALFNVRYLLGETKDISEKLFDYLEELNKMIEEMLTSNSVLKVYDADCLITRKVCYIRDCVINEIKNQIEHLEVYDAEKKSLIKRLLHVSSVLFEILAEIAIYKKLKQNEGI